MLDVIDLYLFISANADLVLMTMVLSPLFHQEDIIQLRNYQ